MKDYSEEEDAIEKDADDNDEEFGDVEEIGEEDEFDDED